MNGALLFFSLCFFLPYLRYRSRLILCVSIEEGGEIQTDEFDCPPEETMSQCGVDGNAKLFVRVVPDPDDEIYEED
jgi:hypothetical protein